jgi:hypothetical protein
VLCAIKLIVAEPRALHTHAIDELKYIRETMASANGFSAIPGWGGVLMGVTALVAAAVAGSPGDARRWLGVWGVEFVLAVTLQIVAIVKKARRSSAPLLASPTRRWAHIMVPPLAAGAVLTAVFAQYGLIARLPGCWLLLYGTSAASGGSMTVRIVPIMGVLFMALGVAAFAAPAAWGNVFMAAGFGGLHIIFGTIIARKHGG